MAKRSASVAFEADPPSVSKEGKKHSLDSDEEDSAAEEEKQNVLNADDIEGEEDGIGGMEGEVLNLGHKHVLLLVSQLTGRNQKPFKDVLLTSSNGSFIMITITPFNMKEELEEGHFDTQGHYHWKKEKEIRDGWLDNIDWVKVKGRPEDKYKVHKDNETSNILDDTDSDSEEEEKFDLIANYKEILNHMKPKETIAKSLQRLGAKSKISSAERWKRKKAGIVDDDGKIVTRITELANQILTKLGNMDVYQETYEQITKIIDKDKNKNGDTELDMYADDFDVKEKMNMTNSETAAGTSDDYEKPKEVQWEFKWDQNSDDISGPHSTQQMHKWSTDGYFKTGVWVRKHGEDSQFYSSSRIDFELYI